jgi:hypothetical protein
MALSFKWSVTKLKVNPSLGGKANVVVNANWLVQATDNVNILSASVSGNCQFLLGDSFTAYDQLTEQQVLDWCFEPVVTIFNDEIITSRLKDEVESQAANLITHQVAQKAAEPALPW